MAHPVLFFLTRHGETFLNLLGRVQGWCDSPLTAKGKADARRLGTALKDVVFQEVFSSDSSRAAETARLILSQGKREPRTARQDPRLREWCFGSLEALPMEQLTGAIFQGLGEELTMEQLNARMPELPAAIRMADTSGWAESFDVISQRLTAFFQEAAAETEASGGGNVLVVSHAFSIKTILYLLAPQRMEEFSKIRNASVTTIRWQEGRFTVERVNQTPPFSQRSS